MRITDRKRFRRLMMSAGCLFWVVPAYRASSDDLVLDINSVCLTLSMVIVGYLFFTSEVM